MTVFEKNDVLWRRYQSALEKRKAELLDNDAYREARGKMYDDLGSFCDVCDMEDAALRQAEREAERTPVYREWLAQAERMENVLESMLPRIETYENGHQTFYDMDGNVIGEKLA